MENNEVQETQEGSLYKVPYTTILDIQPHNNADRLLVATVYGFQVVIPKDRFNIGDKVIYIPIDSILPANVEEILFPADSKIKLHHNRVRQIRIRGLASQGMLVNPSELASLINLERIDLETDLKDFLGIKKYAPPVREMGPRGAPGGRKKAGHPLFHKYNSLNNIKWFPNMFKPGDEVVIQEKLHGMNARASRLPFVAVTFWDKVKKFFKLTPAFENVYGSNNVQITGRANYKGFYDEDIHGATFKSIDVFSKIKDNETVFGEIIGPKIQKNYAYGLNEWKFILFDVKILAADGTQSWLDPKDVESYAKERGFEFVPVLYAGPYNKELAYSLTSGASVYCASQPVREGIVIKAAANYSIEGNKQALKWINEKYLDDKSNTDFN